MARLVPSSFDVVLVDDAGDEVARGTLHLVPRAALPPLPVTPEPDPGDDIPPRPT